MLFLHLIKLVVDVSKIVSGIWLILQFVAFSASRFSFFTYFICLFVVSVLVHFSNRRQRPYGSTIERRFFVRSANFLFGGSKIFLVIRFILI